MPLNASLMHGINEYLRLLIENTTLYKIRAGGNVILARRHHTIVPKELLGVKCGVKMCTFLCNIRPKKNIVVLPSSEIF